MPEIVYRVSDILTQVLQDVPVGTNLGLLHLQVALPPGSLLLPASPFFRPSTPSTLPPALFIAPAPPFAMDAGRSLTCLRAGRWP